jgi:Hemerythrin HHE cation binding domain
VKRDPRLRALSGDHHGALVLARGAARGAESGSGPALESAWLEVRRRFAAELEPHFRIEEERLLPPMLDAGEALLVARTRADHGALRRLVSAGSEAQALARFARLLRDHVRFEEHELFPRAEALLSDAVLEAVRVAASRPGRAEQVPRDPDPQRA